MQITVKGEHVLRGLHLMQPGYDLLMFVQVMGDVRIGKPSHHGRQVGGQNFGSQGNRHVDSPHEIGQSLSSLS